jgi:murein L,D-transpeptidase YafK
MAASFYLRVARAVSASTARGPGKAILSPRMRPRIPINAPVLALVLTLLPLGGAWAQGFGSISSAGVTLPAGSAAAPVAAEPIPAARAPEGNFDVADKVVVAKGQRRLYLLRENQVIAEYPVRLGLNPYGPKQREGDFRTPEGSYRLVRRNPRSDFFLSIQVSYPSEQDLRRARENGARPGGLIMIHGEPNVPRKPADYYARNDWTDGCIAVSNADMVDIWLRTPAGIPIEIRP